MRGIKLLFGIIGLAIFMFVPASQMRAQDSSPSPTPAPSPSPSPESEELKRLKERNDILAEEKKAAEAESDIAKAKKSELETKFPKPSATPLAGDTQVDSGVKIESEMMAYKAMSDAAKKVAKDLENQGLSSLAIYNEKDIKALLAYMLVSNQIQVMQTEYGNLLAPPPSSARRIMLTANRFSLTNRSALVGSAAISTPVAIATSVLGSFIDLVALLRTDTTIKGMDFNIEETAFVSEVFKALKDNRKECHFYYPATFPPNIDPNKTTFRILVRLEQLYLLKMRSEALITSIGETEKSLEDTKAEVASLKAKLKQIAEDIPALDKELERLQKIYWRWPSGRLAERIEDVTGKIDKLNGDKAKLPAQIEQKTGEVAKLEQKLDDLYGQIRPTLDANVKEEVTTAIQAAETKISDVSKILGRAFSPKELAIFYGKGFSDTEQKALINAAEKSLGHELSAQEKTKLLNPLSDAEFAVLKKIHAEETAQGTTLSDDERISLLSESEQVHLLSDPDQNTIRKLKQSSLTKLKTLNTQYDKLIAELTTVDASAGINALTAYLQSENLFDALCPNNNSLGTALACSNAFIMQLKVIRAGGNNKIEKNLVTNLFTGAKLSHSGGAIVQYVLYDLNGAAHFSNTFTVYESYKSSDEVKKLANR